MRKILRSVRAELIAAVLALSIALFFSLHVMHFSHRNDAERQIWSVSMSVLGHSWQFALPAWQTFEAFEYRLYDARFFSRGKQLPLCHDKIVIVGIDENTLARFAWPTPRAQYARLIRRLKGAGAREIVIDVDFSSPQNPRDDAALEKAMQEAGNVLLVSYLTPERLTKNNGQNLGLLLRTTTPLERFDQWTPDLALVYVPLDSDGRARRYPLYGVINDSTVGSVAALSAAFYQKILDGNENKTYEKLLHERRWPALNARVLSVPTVASRDANDKENADAPILFSTPLYFWGPQATFQTDSFLDVLQSSEGDFSPPALKKKFGGKIVFVGATTHFLKDMFPIPAFVRSEDKLVENARDVDVNELPGVEIHATATAMLLDGTYIRTQSTRDALLSLFGVTLGAVFWTVSQRTLASRMARKAQELWVSAGLPGKINTPVWLGSYLLLSALPLVGFSLLAQWFFNQRNLWVLTAYPGLSAATATGAVLIFLFGVESGERRKTEALFSRAASPQLLAKMLASGEDYLKPENICVTVLFSDLEGFTTYSESHSPEEVIDVTNDFLSSVVPIIHKYDGWVDKYIGDAIMAVFGALVPREDHAQVALKCAVEIQEEAVKWRKKTGVAFYMRIGIHTGEVIAGYMGSRKSEGSRERMDYTVIGDTVNLASRLEGKNKEFGSWIMCSSDTFKAAPGVVAAENVSASIKGKSKEVEVYIVRGLKSDPERDKNWAKAAL
jgi:adenylate cyclase